MVETGRRACYAAIAILMMATATIAGAWIVEAVGFAPCELCLAQRWPYYAGIPLAGLAVGLALRRMGRLLRMAFGALALVFAASAVLGAYHVGIESGLWPGPSACTGALVRAGSVQDLLAQLDTVQVVRCDAPALRILGLSLASWNVLVSGALATLALLAGLEKRRPRL